MLHDYTSKTDHATAFKSAKSQEKLGEGRQKNLKRDAAEVVKGSRNNSDRKFIFMPCKMKYGNAKK